MSVNAIPERQNTPEFIRLLRARSQTYRRAVQLQVVQLVLTVAVPVVSAILGLLVVEARPYVAALALAITLIDIAVLDRAMKRRLKTAALICEEFDCALLEMPWNRFAAGKRPSPEIISEADRTWPKGEEKLEDWYPPIVGSAPLHLARIVCQRTNLWYDATLRERYSNVLLIGAIAIVLCLCAAGLIANLSFTDFVVTIVAPSGPLLSWALRDAIKQRETADAQKIARDEAEALWELAIANHCADDECARRSREFQNTIFQRRVNNPLLFPMIYNRLRPEMETDMNLGAAELLRSAGLAKPADASVRA
jgi:hypothetical protein